jgi:flavin-binding protein dodecin
MTKSFDIVERVGLSNNSISEAIQNAVKEANNEFKVAWFEVIEERGRITQDGKIEFQVAVKIGKKLFE